MATTKITSPDLFNLDSLNTELRLPSGTTAQRPASPSAGEWRFNTSTNLVEMYDGSNWYSMQDEDIPPIPSENFNIVLYTGNGSTQSITGVGFQPDYVWIKERSQAESHRWFDSTRGATQRLFSNSTSAQSTASDSLTSFDSDGFSLGVSAGVNENSQSYVAWCWKANGGTTSSNTDGTITSTAQVNKQGGFSILTWTGTGAQGTIGHGLEDTPDVIISKRTDSTNNWSVYHKDLGLSHTSYPNWIYLNLDAAEQNSGTAANHPYYQAPSSTVIYQNTGTSENTNVNAGQYISYCFAEKTGYSSFGSYTGNGSDNGPIVNTGFQVRYIMLKCTSGTHSWLIYDASRPGTSMTGDLLYADTDQAENPLPPRVLFLSNGFQIVTNNTSHNASGLTYIYMTFASDPSAAPVLADSFDVGIYTGDGTSNRVINTVGFRPDLYWLKTRDTSGCTYNNWFDTLRGGNKTIYSNASSAEVTNQGCGYIQSFDSLGVTYTGDASGINNSGEDFVYWAWKANSIPSILTDGTIQSIASANQAAGFSIVKYVGNGVQGATVAHGLGSAPDMIIIKDLSSSEVWLVGNSESGWTKAMHLDLTNADNASNLYWDDTAPTSTLFSIGAFGTSYNVNGNQYIAYCWYSISGFSKIGSYTGTGTGTNQLINTGFASSWVMIKDVSAGGSWFVIDSERGGSKSLKANTADAESTTNYITFESNGFRVAGDANATSTWLYLSFKENPGPVVPAGQMAYLVVAGGAGGGGTVFPNKGGGGGAGGLRTSFGSTSGGGASAESNITLASGTYTITVGAGGGAAANGAASTITGAGSVSTVGGGQGGAITVSGTAGGSGGGTGGNNGGSITGGAGTAGEGFAGGTTAGNAGYDGSGGGGAAQVGGNGGFRNSTGGVGGNGLAVSITGTSTYYAGGGGGGSDSSSTGGRPGGLGGGGAGGDLNVVGGNGTANLGAGAGAGGENAQPGSGGSGVVILRLRTSDYSGTTTGSPTVTTTGEETIITYTGSGTYVHS